MKPKFLTLDEILKIHNDQIKKYGGSELDIDEEFNGLKLYSRSLGWFHNAQRK